jgi:hypothetical protein
MNFGEYALLGWTREEWLIAVRWAEERGTVYPPTLQGGSELQDAWRRAHEPPPKPEEIWFARFRKALA